MLKVWLWVWVVYVGVLGGLPASEGLGVNWGTFSVHRLPPEVVVQMMKDNGIEKVKLFDAEEPILNALAGSDIEVMVAIPNYLLATVTNYDEAKEWVHHNVTRYKAKGVNIKYVAVGNEPFLTSYNGTYVNSTFPALKNIQNALNEAGLGESIKATVPLNADVYISPWYNPVPSAGRFRSDIDEQMTQVVQFLNQSNAPFTVNIYPFLSLYLGYGNFPLDYAFFDGISSPLVDSNGLQYTNAFEANLDTLISSLTAVGCGNMTIFVGEVGWPTDGNPMANIELAHRFYKGLLPRLAANKGTPLRPGLPIEVYMFGLMDEDAKSIDPGNFERSWGIFRYDGQPKFPMDLSGKDQNKSLVAARNVTYLPKKWCEFNGNVQNLTKLQENVEYACKYADCTALGYGSSCNGLDANGNASYAFNMYFQAQNQQDLACDFQGLAKMTTKNISQSSCNFTIQIAPPPSPTPALAPTPTPTAAPGDSSTPSSSSHQPHRSSSAPSSSSSLGRSPFLALAILMVFVCGLL